MSRNWQESWTKAVEYWAREWRRWLGVAAVTTAWLWAVFLIVPSLTPFLFMEFQPINSQSIATTYQHQLTALEQQLPLLLIVLVISAVLGVLLLIPSLRRRVPRPGLFQEVLWSGVMTVLSLLALAALRVPIGGSYLSPLPMAIRGIAVLGFAVVLIPWAFWSGPFKVCDGGAVLNQFRAQMRETLFLAWTWLLCLVMAELLSASLAWTTTSTDFGTLVLAALITGLGLLHQSVAYFYSQQANRPRALQKTS